MRIFQSAVCAMFLTLSVALPSAAAGKKRVDPACKVIKRFKLACASTSIGAVVADTPGDAERLRAHAIRGEERFRRFLGVEPDQYLFVAGNGGRYTEAAKAIGRKSSLNWPSAAQRMDTTALRVAATATYAKLKMREVDRASAIDAFVKANSSTKADQDAIDAIAVPHELTHVWFTRAFWPSAPLAHDNYYAGPGPDWLDEGVAQIMETTEPVPLPLSKYKEAIAGQYAIQRGHLRELLTAEHPGQKMKKLFAGRSFIPEAETRALGLDPARFYVRSAALTAFILARSGKDQLLAEIGRAYADGSGFERWLERNGSRYGLGSTINDMEKQLLHWLAEQGRLPAS